MSLRINLIFFCIFLGLWSSTSGRRYEIYGKNRWYIGKERCNKNGDENVIATSNVTDHILQTLPYDFFNATTIIKIDGLTVIKVVAEEPVETRSMLLNEYYEGRDEKVYEGRLNVVGYNLWQKQQGHVGVRLTIPRVGVPTIRHYIYLGSWGAVLGCVSVFSDISSIVIYD